MNQITNMTNVEDEIRRLENELSAAKRRRGELSEKNVLLQQQGALYGYAAFVQQWKLAISHVTFADPVHLNSFDILAKQMTEMASAKYAKQQPLRIFSVKFHNLAELIHLEATRLGNTWSGHFVVGKKTLRAECRWSILVGTCDDSCPSRIDFQNFLPFAANVLGSQQMPTTDRDRLACIRAFADIMRFSIDEYYHAHVALIDPTRPVSRGSAMNGERKNGSSILADCIPECLDFACRSLLSSAVRS